ncbi:GMC oxidoreductase [Lophiostoma macrostomum CBS 122681]|uniref:GMC oxidoreductase n=1 Tax=Lophiostoma macrostomum CBS 122681 TaxID=1314788 RepID=A0A6A6TFB3_9PLEO|nr:GMC oxidoreductase [Lophiostoma macrostomum CBS 122681]
MKSALVLFGFAWTRVLAQSTEYEYVVIGSGPGGGPVAANLARAGHSVFLIEAGGDHGDNLLQQIPSFADPSAEDPTLSWQFYVNHYQDETQAYRDTKYTWRNGDGTLYVGTDPPDGAEPLGILYPRAGTLGGCGNHNAMNLALPPDNDWEYIANLTGDSTWRADTMRKYFETIENNNYVSRNSSNSTATAGHGFNGWLGSNRNEIDLFDTQPGFVKHLRNLFCATGNECPTNDQETFTLLQRDLNRIDRDRYEANSLYQLPLHEDSMRRRSSSQTYLRDTINELNEDGSQKYPLTISINSLATRVLLDTSGETPRATGVSYLLGQALYRADSRNNGLQNGTPLNVTATREVIVSGGTFNTPQILKLSGIGPAEELANFSIPLVKDLPAVGTNLIDNYEAGIRVEAATPHGSPFANCTNLAPGDPCLREWREHGTGPYGMGAAPAGMLYRSSVSENADTDLFLFGAAAAVFDGYFPGFSTESASLNTSFWSIVKMQYQNLDAGTVTLRSADPQDTPLINFNYFTEGRDHDLQALFEGVQFVLGVMADTPPPYGPYKVIVPDPSVDIKQAIMNQAFSHHAAGTCKIGLDDTDSCVDSRFRVHGVDGLRVVDASVFPKAMGGFPILPTFLVSTKASDLILQDATVGNATIA